jgi:hypothetical protein
VGSYPSQAIVVAKDSRDSKITNKMEDQMMEKLNELTNQFSEMKVNMAELMYSVQIAKVTCI